MADSYDGLCLQRFLESSSSVTVSHCGRCEVIPKGKGRVAVPSLFLDTDVLLRLNILILYVCSSKNGISSLCFWISGELHLRMFLIQVQLRLCTMHPKVWPTWGLSPWPLHYNRTFHDPKTLPLHTESFYHSLCWLLPWKVMSISFYVKHPFSETRQCFHCMMLVSGSWESWSTLTLWPSMSRSSRKEMSISSFVSFR